MMRFSGALAPDRVDPVMRDGKRELHKRITIMNNWLACRRACVRACEDRDTVSLGTIDKGRCCFPKSICCFTRSKVPPATRDAPDASQSYGCTFLRAGLGAGSDGAWMPSLWKYCGTVGPAPLGRNLYERVRRTSVQVVRKQALQPVGSQSRGEKWANHFQRASVNGMAKQWQSDRSESYVKSCFHPRRSCLPRPGENF